jgi:MarR family transcriptional regulator for hemolysin
MPRPLTDPIGLRLARTAKVVSRAFDDALAEVGGSLPVWLVLVSLKARVPGAQRELAEALGIEGPTLTHHLARMEAAGLVSRHRDPDNRRIQRVELTAAGEVEFERLRHRVVAFDELLRAGMTVADVAALGALLDRLQANVGAGPDPAAADPVAAAGTAPADAESAP